MKFDLRKFWLSVVIFTLLFVSVKNDVFAATCTAPSGNCYVPAGVGVDPSTGELCSNDHWTTCIQGYVCSISDSGPGKTGACVKPGTNPGTCDWSQSNCPPGTNPDYNQLLSSYCGKITYCPGPGTAQTKGDCGDCRWIPDCYTDPKTGKETCKEDIWSCTHQLINTYKCVVPATVQPTVVPTVVPTISPTRPPSSIVTKAYCSMNKIYTNNWVELTPTAFKGLSAGVQVYFCVNGVTNSSVFDSGRFTINGVLRPETTLNRPGSDDFCDLYTIPANTYSFKVQGEIHHTVLGWL
jgi:hypothetical protein